MSSMSFSKLKSLLPLTRGDNPPSRKSKKVYDKLEPELGFKLMLTPTTANAKDESASKIPELTVMLVGARHLPSSFGLKSVQGYVVKVKLFPGSTQYNSTVQTSSWPTFKEEFKFPMGSQNKSSIKSRSKSSHLSQSLPEKLFKGHFVVLTVFALLELPPGAIPGLKEKLAKLGRKSSFLSKDRDEKVEKDICKLTTSETRRNIGSVTCFLNPKIFDEDLKTAAFNTEEFWQPVKDITVTPSSTSTQTANASPKGQVEIILQLVQGQEESDSTNESNEALPTSSRHSRSSSRKSKDGKSDKEAHSEKDHGKSWMSLNEVKRKIRGSMREKNPKGLCLKITTSKMRCSIKVKEQFESVTDYIYVKTTAFEHGILSSAWKTDHFSPSLSTRFNSENSVMYVNLPNEQSLEHVSIKTSVATKNKVGKKIVFGTILIGPNSKETKLDHWEAMIAGNGAPITMWHSFE